VSHPRSCFITSARNRMLFSLINSITRGYLITHWCRRSLSPLVCIRALPLVSVRRCMFVCATSLQLATQLWWLFWNGEYTRTKALFLRTALLLIVYIINSSWPGLCVCLTFHARGGCSLCVRDRMCLAKSDCCLLLLCRTKQKSKVRGIVDFRIWREAGDLDLHKASMILFALQVRLVQEFAFEFALFEHSQCAGGRIWQRERRWRFCDF